MRKSIKLILIFTMIAIVIFSVFLFVDRACLDHRLIRMHVVANSNSEDDQNLKLQVRDHVLAYLQNTLDEDCDIEDAKAHLHEHLGDIEREVNIFIRDRGSDHRASVSLKKETFDIREYDTFTLPSGVYESLRVVIGEGQGRNWWCVAFPRLCLNTSDSDFEETAVGAGFSYGLVPTLQQKDGYKVRFFLLDILGKIENFFF